MSMTCIEFRQRVGAEPLADDPELASHRLACRGCNQFARSQQALDRQLAAALALPVPDGLEARIHWRAAADRPAWRRGAGIAASLLLSLGLGFSAWYLGGREQLAPAVIAHIKHEPQLLVQTANRADAQLVNAVMSRGGLGLRASLGNISHAGLCPFRGRLVPHLVMVVEGEPVSVLLLPNEHADGVQEIHEDGFNGLVLPAAEGSMAIVAGRAELIVPVRQKLEQAVNWGI